MTESAHTHLSSYRQENPGADGTRGEWRSVLDLESLAAAGLAAVVSDCRLSGAGAGVGGGGYAVKA